MGSLHANTATQVLLALEASSSIHILTDSIGSSSDDRCILMLRVLLTRMRLVMMSS